MNFITLEADMFVLCLLNSCSQSLCRKATRRETPNMKYYADNQISYLPSPNNLITCRQSANQLVIQLANNLLSHQPPPPTFPIAWFVRM